MVLLVNGTGTIEVQVQLPATNPALNLIKGSTVSMSNVQITGAP